jgi:alpha-N-arabinofuranosidase
MRWSIVGANARVVNGELLTAAAVDAYNSFDRPDEVAQCPFAVRVPGGQLLFDLPAKSIGVVELR